MVATENKSIKHRKHTFTSLLYDVDDRKQFNNYFTIIVISIIVFIILSMITTVDQTLTVTGHVRPLSKIAEIKHDVGGEVIDIQVDDYMHVKKGQHLVTLDNNKILTGLKQNQNKLSVVDREIINAFAYLQDNIVNIKETEIYKEVEQYLNNIGDAILNSKQLTEASRIISDHKDEVILEQIKMNQIEISKTRKDLESLNNKLEYVDEQRKIYNILLESKNVSKVRALDYEVKYIDLVREIEQASSHLDMKIRENKELESKRIVSEQDGIKEKYEELVKLNKEKIDLVANIAQLDDMLKNLSINAPISGTIQGLKIVKGVKVQPGEVIATIIPDNAQLVFEAKADLMQKGKISLDNISNIQFDGFNILEFNRIPANIINISPYTFDDVGSKDQFFKVLFKINEPKVVSKDKEYIIKPGMSGVAYINSGKRSLFSYIFGPIYNSFHNAYNER